MLEIRNLRVVNLAYNLLPIFLKANETSFFNPHKPFLKTAAESQQSITHTKVLATIFIKEH